MSGSFEDELKAEVMRLEGELAIARGMLSKYRDWKQKQAVAARTAESPSVSNGGNQPTEVRVRLRPAPPVPVNKTQFILKRIEEAGASGITSADIYRAIHAAHLKMTNDHARSVLWNSVKDGKIVKRPDGRFVTKQQEPGVGAPGSH